jgi:succinate dehydrogenase / fumarate reductase, membrane anchor subunit
MVNRLVVGAHYGLRDWLAQRITAIVMVIYTLLFVVMLLRVPALDHAAWRGMFAPQWMKLATLLFLLSVYYHAWVGVRNIFMDYIKHGGVRLALHCLVIAALIVYVAWSAQILWSV